MTDYAPTAFSREIAARIRGYMARYNVSQAEMAVLCDVTQSQFSKMLRGVRPITVDHLVVMCEALGVNMPQLVSEVWSFVQNRHIASSPLTYVEFDERLDEPIVWREAVLDPWGKQAHARLNVGAPVQDDIHAADLREDFDLAASDDASAVDPDREP